MTLLPDLARVLAAAVAVLLGLTAPEPPAARVVEVPVVRSAAERVASGGDRVRRIAAPPRRAASAAGGRNDRVSSDETTRRGTGAQATGGRSRSTADPGGTTSRSGGSTADSGRTTSRSGGSTAGGTTRGSGTAGSSASGSDGATAAAVHGWGTPSREDDFSGALDGWGIYDGSGHDGNGRRSPSAVTVTDGILTITGTSDGTTGGMAWNPGRQYGRWEARVKSPAGDPDLHSVLLLWPDAENWPVGGEVDFMEISDSSRQNVEMFLHYGADNSQVQGDVDIDATEWHNWAVEWTPDHIAAFVDGEEWWRTDDTGILPPGPMHLTIQLDNFGSPQQETTMHVDWVREYDV